MKILLVDEAYPLNTRNTKILGSLARCYPDADFHIVTWDRAGQYDAKADGEDHWQWHLYTRPATYGNRMQKLAGMSGYRTFCSQVVRGVAPDVVIASHWNNLLMLPRLDHGRQMLIYENLDAPTGPALGRWLLNRVEACYMKRAALTVHASRFYTQIYPRKYRQLVLENKPVIATEPVDYTPASPLRIAYLGNVRYLDILKNLADAVRGDDRFVLYYHGGGPDYAQLKEYTASARNIHMTGPYRYEDIERLYRQTDIIWAAYPNRDFNVRYAISNKFHESMAYAIPAIYADNTCLGRYVEDNGTGYQVDPYSVEAIKKLLDGIVCDMQGLRVRHEALKVQYRNETSWDEDFMKLKAEIDAFFIR